LMLKAYVDAYNTFGVQNYLEMAINNAGFILKYQIKPDNSLYHNFKEGKSTINAHLEDYALVIEAFLSLYQTTSDEQWLQKSKELTDYTIQHFNDKESHMFYFTSDLDPEMITRKIETYDGVIPSSNSVMAHNLFKLSHFFENKSYKKKSEQMLKNVLDQAFNYGSGYSNWLLLYSDFIGEFYEIAIAGKEAKSMVEDIEKRYIPNKIIAASNSDSDLPLLKDRFADNKTLIYVCIDGACLLPKENVEEALKQIDIKYRR